MNTLANDLLELSIQLPGEKYRSTRFDWTGQITQVKYKKSTFCTNELPDKSFIDKKGRGLYNEFGIELGLGYDECPVGGEFHKIGVGAIKKKTNDAYDFFKDYECQPAIFNFHHEKDNFQFECRANELNGFAYDLNKKIILSDKCFMIEYELRNTGSKRICTNEYVHNFLAINHCSLNSDYYLHLSHFVSMPAEALNPENKILFTDNSIHFKAAIEKEFFFSDILTQNDKSSWWMLENRREKLAIKESCDFKPQKVNLWGTKHVISPEIFFEIDVEAGQSIAWKRKYEIMEL